MPELGVRSLTVRLGVAFAVVAVAAVATLAGLMLAASRSGVSDLVARTHAVDAQAAATAAARAYERAGGWDGADLSAASAIAARGQATLSVLDPDGRLVAAPLAEAAEMMARMHGVELLALPRGGPVSATVRSGGEPVGTVLLRFPASHLPTPERHVRDALARTVLVGAVLATVVAGAVAVLVARRLARPVLALTHAAEAVAAGRKDTRVGPVRGPREVAVLATTFDRMAEHLQEEDDLRRRLVHDVAHEVRTPLTILRATTEGLVDGVLPPDRPVLEGLHEEVVRLSGLVEDLQDLAAADAARVDLTRSAVDLAEVAAATAELCRGAASEAGLALEVDLASAPVVGDRERLRQIATNLVANALRYTPAGGAVRLSSGTRDGDSWLAVCDTGPGIAPEELGRLFERFYRGTAAEGVEGSGVGLSVAARLAEAHGGRLEAANRAGGGASFTLTVPRAR